MQSAPSQSAVVATTCGTASSFCFLTLDAFYTARQFVQGAPSRSIVVAVTCEGLLLLCFLTLDAFYIARLFVQSAPLRSSAVSVTCARASSFCYLIVGACYISAVVHRSPYCSRLRQGVTRSIFPRGRKFTEVSFPCVYAALMPRGTVDCSRPSMGPAYPGISWSHPETSVPMSRMRRGLRWCMRCWRIAGAGRSRKKSRFCRCELESCCSQKRRMTSPRGCMWRSLGCAFQLPMPEFGNA